MQHAPLAGRTALVTGAAGVIGAAVATRLADDGAHVLVCDRDARAAEAVAARITASIGATASTGGAAAGGAVASTGSAAARALAADVTDPASLAAALADVDRLDVVINVAGIVRDAPLHRMTDADWHAVTDVNLTGAFHVLRATAALLRERAAHHRKVVNLTSNVALHGAPGTANYAAAKAGLIGLTKTLAREWAARQVNVNAVAPGLVTGAGTTASKPAELIERVQRQIPIGRAATPEDVAAAVAFLAGPGSDVITGQVLELSGGLEVPR